MKSLRVYGQGGLFRSWRDIRWTQGISLRAVLRTNRAIVCLCWKFRDHESSETRECWVSAHEALLIVDIDCGKRRR